MGEAAESLTLRRCLLAAGVGMALVAAGCSGVSSPRASAPVTSVAATTTALVDGATVPPESTNPDVLPPTSTRPDTASTNPEESAVSGESGASESEAQQPDGEDPEAAPDAREPDGLAWEDAATLTFEIDGDVVELDDGSAVVSYGGASKSVFTLQNLVAQGDLDGDGDQDLVAYIVERSPGSGVFHLILPVIDDDGIAVAGQPVAVGDRVVMDSISIEDGAVVVVLFDRALDEPLTVITRRTTLKFAPTSSAPPISVVDIQPIDSLPLPGPARADIEVRFDAGAVSATESGSIDFRERQTFIVQAAAGQAFTAALEAPLGVWLDVRLEDHVVVSAAERSQSVEVELPVAGAWRATVVSSHAGQAQFELTVEALPLETEPPAPRPTPTVRPAVQPVGQSGDVVYLTFDDGPHPVYTPQVLDVLARYGARATFFVIGSQAEAHPDLIRRIAAEGHTIANHTWNHEDLAGLSRASFDETISRTQAVLADLAAPCLRPPYASVGALTREWASSHGLSLVMWDASPQDWLRPPAAEIADYIVRWARPGVVMLLHDGGGDRSRTVQGLDMALERLADQGLRFEPVCR